MTGEAQRFKDIIHVNSMQQAFNTINELDRLLDETRGRFLDDLRRMKANPALLDSLVVTDEDYEFMPTEDE